ncbi:hypothetical protein EDD69_10797 [Thermolongibacillus altinsuensis]|uniref:Uncharacterized protein n=1 Tax=Thermolongibacillus altinsuensis TaxID=575256 RepID=A0A4R1QG30_9BACL|nr:hypothetical protein [Thermolongibacillus altinsuensis]TCL49274.1 hypothetical protein EDD69_10797 [Thermolongibacillus altinsuensis]GMB10130.1 hypothetical protein B1no1_28400 [Thermolongibacillus altinsuensis]
MKNRSFPVAYLESNALEKIQDLEKKLREETGEEIVLIAYKREEELN